MTISVRSNAIRRWSTEAAQSDPGDEALVAGGDHGRQLTVEQFAIDVARGVGIVAPVNAKVHRGQPVDLEGAQVVLDALP